MKRREFIGALGGAAAWPVVARAQQPAMPVIGVLNSRSRGETMDLMTAFRSGLREADFVEGRNVAIEFRWAEGRYEQLAALAAELVRRPVTILATGGGLVSAVAAKAATATIPIVFAGGSDPIGLGLVASLNRPGGNITGVLNIVADLIPKLLEILRDLVPAARRVAVLRNPGNPEASLQLKGIENAARLIGLQFDIASASTETAVEPTIARLMQNQPDVLLLAPDPFFATVRRHLIEVISRYMVPAMYPQREYVEAGGLISYATNFADVYRQSGAYVGRILKGDRPADLPVQGPTRFELVINLKTAKSLGLTVPPLLLARADEVIE